jgi:hypothetical protein
MFYKHRPHAPSGRRRTLQTHIHYVTRGITAKGATTAADVVTSHTAASPATPAAQPHAPGHTQIQIGAEQMMARQHAIRCNFGIRQPSHTRHIDHCHVWTAAATVKWWLSASVTTQRSKTLQSGPGHGRRTRRRTCQLLRPLRTFREYAGHPDEALSRTVTSCTSSRQQPSHGQCPSQ